MAIRTRTLVFVITMIVGLALPACTEAQRAGSDSLSLRGEIMRADSALFAAFNARDLSAMGRFFTADLEFYQDNEGVENYTQTLHDFAQMFAQPPVIHRELVPGSLEVYPIKDYGAIEVGMHRFCHIENGKNDCGTFKFVHIWRRADGRWAISRVVSYAH